MKKRVAIVASHVIQYQDPFFRLLACDPAIDLTVIYGSRAGLEAFRDRDMQTTVAWDIELLAGYESVFVRNFGFGEGYTRLINPGVVWQIVRGRFDAVILMLGWGSITALLAVAACRATGTPVFLFGDSSHPPPIRGVAGRMRAAFLRGLFALASGFMVSGVLNAAYYEHYGADRKRFFLLPFAVDNERFARASQFGAGERDSLRARFGVEPGQMAIAFSGKLVARKDPMTLLRAYDRMRHRDRAALVFLGNGPLRDEMDAFIRERGLERVAFTGFVNQADLPRHYAMCDVFVLPSTFEPRGLVINEAMACGLPLVVSDVVGAVGDLALEGETALVFPAGDDVALAAALDRLVEDEALRARMAARSREVIATWDFARGVEGVKAAVRSLP